MSFSKREQDLDEQHEATCNGTSPTCQYHGCVEKAVQEEEDKDVTCEGCNTRLPMSMLIPGTRVCPDCEKKEDTKTCFYCNGELSYTHTGNTTPECDECGAPKNSEVCQECIDLKKYGEYPFEEENDYCENCFAKSLDDCICREGDPE